MERPENGEIYPEGDEITRKDFIEASIKEDKDEKENYNNEIKMEYYLIEGELCWILVP